MNLRVSLVFAASFALSPIAVLGAAGCRERRRESCCSDAAVKAAVDMIRAAEPQTIEDQIRLCEVEAPPFKEAKRAEMYAQMFREAGLQNVRIDKEGNVLGDRPRRAAAAAARVHRPPRHRVSRRAPTCSVKREGTMLRGPGIGDDCRGLAVLLAVARAMNRRTSRRRARITFVGTVGEEGLGDLRGVKYLFSEGMKGQIDRFVSIDGTGLGITHIAVGSQRYRVTFKGPGGHSYGAFGMVEPDPRARPRDREDRATSRSRASPRPRSTSGASAAARRSTRFRSTRGWKSTCARPIPRRSGARREISERAVDDAVADENARWGSNVADRGQGARRRFARRAGRRTTRRSCKRPCRRPGAGFPIALDEGSTDANIPMSLGIPAITIDGGGRGTGAHALDEAFDSTNSWMGRSARCCWRLRSRSSELRRRR